MLLKTTEVKRFSNCGFLILVVDILFLEGIMWASRNIANVLIEKRLQLKTQFR